MKKSENMIVISLLISVIMLSTHFNSYAKRTVTDEIYTSYPVPSKQIRECAYTPEATTWEVWAPACETVVLRLYKTGTEPKPIEEYQMEKTSDGLWTLKLTGDQKGKFYTFQIKQDGKWRRETQGIFARAVGVNGGRGAVVDFTETDPEGWQTDKYNRPSRFTDLVIYEVHFRDYSMHESVNSQHRGKFLSLTEKGITTADGQKAGLDHLKELGITHVHILPSFDYGSIDETTLEKNNYNWGYDPLNYNVPEGSYSSDPFDPVSRVKEFKQMVKELHEAGIGVIMDVVYNHTITPERCGFENTAPGYFYRHRPDGRHSNGSGCGNDIASEREMVRKFITESVKYWIEEYHVDGFRFDLMGLHDIETMNHIRSEVDAIDPNIFIYGEGWAAGPTPYDRRLLAMKESAYKMPGIAAFSDDIRDGIRGRFGDYHKATFITGKTGAEESIKFGIAAAVEHPGVDITKVPISRNFWAAEPSQFISYVSCHDDHCLRDRLFEITGHGEASQEELLRLDKLAQTIVFMSQGVPFIFAGEEVFRTKQGVGNSYKSPDTINAIDWNNKTMYSDLFIYYKELIALRKKHPALGLGTAELVNRHLEFIDSEIENVVIFRLTDIADYDPAKEIIVVINSNREDINVTISDGNYISEIENGSIDLNGIKSYKGGKVSVAPQSVLFLASY